MNSVGEERLTLLLLLPHVDIFHFFLRHHESIDIIPVLLFFFLTIL